MSLIFKKSTAQPQFTDPAAITGTAEVGQTLTCTYTVTKARANNVIVRWYRYDRTDGVAPTGETLLGTGSTYVLTGNEVGKYVRAIVTATNPAGTVTSTSSFTAAVVNTETPPDAPTLTSPATISGTAEVGGTLTVAYGFDGETSVEIQWWAYTSAGKTGGVEMGTASTQALTFAEDGKYIGCEVTARNAAGDYVSVADLVGPVAADATAAPTYTAEAVISLDEGADGFNEGEYIVCNFGVSGATELPTVAWYKCDAGKANPELLTGAGEACIKPLPVSEPNNYRAALFLNQSLGLNAAGKYVYAVARAVNSEAPSGVTSESGIVGPVGAIQGTPISQATVGDGPYYLPNADTTYYLTEDISTKGSGIIMPLSGQRLNLNGKTLTFDDAEPAGLVNGGFETGDFTGWDITNAPSASIYAVDDPLYDWNFNRYNSGSYSCEFDTSIHATPITEQYLEQADIVLERYKWYSLSVMAALASREQRTGAGVYVRVFHGGELHAETRFIQPADFSGMRFVEAVFQAYHADPIYTIQIGVTGVSGGIDPVYLDDIQLTRSHTAGVASVLDGTAFNNRADEVELTTAGSGYTDGQYFNLQSQRVSGPTGIPYPRLDVTVSGGVVTAVALRSEEFKAGETVVTIPTDLGGGSGSGAQIRISRRLPISGLPLENRGTGYANGTYYNVQTEYVSGPTAAAYPILNRVDIVGGAVRNATWNPNGATFLGVGTVLKVTDSAIGGGSGFTATISGLAPYQYGGRNESIPNSLMPLDCAPASLQIGTGRTVKNGIITQGQDRGTQSNALFADAHHSWASGGVDCMRVHRVDATTTGLGSGVLVVRKSNPVHSVVIADCNFTSLHRVNPDRHNRHASCVGHVRGRLARSTFRHSGGTGVNGVPGLTSPTMRVYGCQFYQQMVYTNQSSLIMAGGNGLDPDQVGSECFDNIFHASGDYYGRVMHLSLSGKISVYNNIIRMEASRWNREYNGTWTSGDPAVQFEGGTDGGLMQFYGNRLEIQANGPLLVGRGNSTPLTSGGVRWSSVNKNATLVCRDNVIIANATGQAHAVPWMVSSASNGVFDIRDNTTITDSEFWTIQNNLLARVYREKFTLLPRVADDARLFYSVWPGSNPPLPHMNVDFIDIDATSEDIATLVASGVRQARWNGSGWESASFGGFRIKWTITVACGVVGASVVIKNASNVTVASGLTNEAGAFIAEVQQHYVAGSTATTTTPHVIEVTSGELSGSASFNADAPKTVNVSLS